MKKWKSDIIKEKRNRKKQTIIEGIDETAMENSKLFKLHLREEMGWEEFEEGYYR